MFLTWKWHIVNKWPQQIKDLQSSSAEYIQSNNNYARCAVYNLQGFLHKYKHPYYFK